MPELSEALRLFITNTGSISRLEVGGELDLATLDELRDHLDLLVESGTGDVDVDFALVRFCDATTLSALVAADNQLAAGGRMLRIVAASGRVVQLFQLIDLEGMLTDDVAMGGGHGNAEGAVGADRQASVRALS